MAINGHGKRGPFVSNNEFRMNPIHLRRRKPPENMLRLVASDTKSECLKICSRR